MLDRLRIGGQLWRRRGGDDFPAVYGRLSGAEAPANSGKFRLRLVVSVPMVVLDLRNIKRLESYDQNTTRPYKTNHINFDSDLPLAEDADNVGVAASTVGVLVLAPVTRSMRKRHIDADNRQANGQNQQAYENAEIALMRQQMAGFMAAKARQNNQAPRGTTMLEADGSDVFFQDRNPVQSARNQRQDYEILVSDYPLGET
ncbi:unnamed protein product [Cochlearia groenlandica]